MEKIINFLKKSYGILIIILLSCIFINWYLGEQTAFQETTMIFYYKYVELNNLLSTNIKEGVNLFFNSFASDTRNHVFALLLRPVYLLFNTSHKAYIWGVFFVFFIPSVFVIIKFLNLQIAEKDEKDKFLKYFISFMVLSTPIFWYTTIIGYPDIFSLGLFCCALILFFKYPFTKKVPFKILILFSLFCYLSFIFRRWFLIVTESFVISYLINFFLNCYIEKISLEQLKSQTFNLFKNFLIFGCLFLILMGIFNNQVFDSLLNPHFRDLFDGYKVPFEVNFYNVVSYISFPIVVMVVLILYKLFDIPKNRAFITLSFINLIVYFLIFASIEVLCIDHLVVFNFWLICFLTSGIAAIYKTMSVNKYKKALIVIIMFLFGINFVCLFIGKKPAHIKFCFQNTFWYVPYKPNNIEILKNIEAEVKNKADENPYFTYSIWAFENNSFNQQLIFQDGNIIKYYKKNSFPPLVDIEAIVNGIYAGVVSVDLIYTTEPLQPYIYKKDNKILFYVWEVLKQGNSFGTAFKRIDTGMRLHNGEKVIKYERIRPVTKEDYIQYVSKITEMYPFAKEYISKSLKKILEEN